MNFYALALMLFFAPIVNADHHHHHTPPPDLSLEEYHHWYEQMKKERPFGIKEAKGPYVQESIDGGEKMLK